MSKTVDINVHHVTRVEGHGNIVVKASDGVVEKVEWQVPEAPRFFEAMIRGRSWDEIQPIVSRICGICSVSHTLAAVKAVETLDKCLGRIEKALLKVGGQALITADHGNCEQMLDYDSGQQHTQHTTDLVPLVFIGSKQVSLQNEGGILADIAPTLLGLMELPQPPEMTGSNLLTERA